ncbi:hypothetical protein [Mycolicibacterium fortuitum]
MTYPNGPYGQGFPHQPGYPQPGYPQQPYGAPAPLPASPTAVTGIIASILAGLGALANIVGGGAMAFALSLLISDSSEAAGPAWGGWTPLIAMTVLNIVAGLLLLVGAVTLLLRKMIGRWLVAAGCAVSIVSTVISLTWTPSVIADYEYDGGVDTGLVGVFFPIATLVLVLLPSTASWIRAKQNRVASQFYPPYPG